MSTYEVSVCVSFRAAHALPLPGGELEDVHEHTWDTTATFRAASIDNEMGVVIDFLEVRGAMENIASQLDDKNLNNLDAFNVFTTSAENVAAHISRELALILNDQGSLYRVSVTEAPGCTAAYYPGDT
jgi:6-pyruvoyltetrahydropterin/6-carboxytetrahydropterin synthase